MLFVEVAGFARFNIDHADDAILRDERNGQFRAHIGNGFDVAGILGYIVNQNRLPRLGRLAGDALADFNAAAFSKFRRIANLKTESDLEFFR